MSGGGSVRREKGVEWLGLCRGKEEGLSGGGPVVRREKGVEWLGLCRGKEEGLSGGGPVVRREKGVEWWGQTTSRMDCGTTQMGPLLGTPLHHPSSSQPLSVSVSLETSCTSMGCSDS